MASIWPHIVTGISAIFAAGGLWTWLGRRTELRTQQPAVDMQAVSGASLALIEQLQEELTTARAVTSAVGRLEAQVGVLESRVATVIGWIHAPDMTLDLLRRLVPMPSGGISGAAGGNGPGFNGR